MPLDILTGQMQQLELKVHITRRPLQTSSGIRVLRGVFAAAELRC